MTTACGRSGRRTAAILVGLASAWAVPARGADEPPLLPPPQATPLQPADTLHALVQGFRAAPPKKPGAAREPLPVVVAGRSPSTLPQVVANPFAAPQANAPREAPPQPSDAQANLPALPDESEPHAADSLRESDHRVPSPPDSQPGNPRDLPAAIPGELVPTAPPRLTPRDSGLASVAIRPAAAEAEWPPAPHSAAPLQRLNPLRMGLDPRRVPGANPLR